MLLLRVLKDGEIVWPYDRAQLEADFPQPHNFPADLRLAGLSDFDVFEVIEAPLPEPAPGQTVREIAPAKLGGTWTRQFELVDPTADDFAIHEASLHGLIDAEAGAFRTRFITDVPGQQQTYAEKEAEARAWSANPDGTYPFLAAEAAARSISVADVAAEIIATADAWRGLGALIEATRIAAKRAVTAARAAGDWAAMTSAGDIDWEGLLA